MSWESIIDESLVELDSFLQEGNWFGRENEIINLFAHRFLIKRIKVGPLIDPSQIGVEVAVKQVPQVGKKKLVRKDLVLWGEPLQTVWGSGRILNDPAVILEWKINEIKKCAVDIEWLLAYTKLHPQVLGYSICVFMNDKKDIWFRKIKRGEVVSVLEK